MPSHEACCGTMFWVYLMSCFGLVMFAGLMSGLTLGLMSLSLVDLEVLSKAGTPRDKRNAARILPVVKNQHLLLCTLLIGNSLAMEALPIFLDTLVPPYVAILISVTLILAFGEIIPQAICTRYGLSVGAKAAPVVRVLLILFFPVAYPISKSSKFGTMFWVYLMSCFGLVMFAGLMSGLTLGLMSLSLVDLEVLSKAGTPRDKRNAARILPVVKNQHLLLCTLLIGNSLAMEALPIFLDTLVPPYVAILISVTLILAFGEIIPQAICTRYGLSVGAKAAPVVRVLLILFFPVAYPISKLLDWLLGKGHFALMRRAELKTLVDMHGNEAGKGGELTHDETTIITGALELTQKIAKDAMTPISKTFSLDINAKLDLYTMGMIMTRGHSRVPIYSGIPSNIIGLILVKNLITCRAEDEVPIRNVTIRKIPRVADDLPLYDILNEFQKGHSHMAVVVKRTKEAGASTEKQKSTTADYKINPKDAHADGSSPSASTAGSRRINIEKHGDGHSYNKKSERKRENILDFNTDPLPSYSMDEEAIGIITMEDVMEELLQEEIYDETDEYVDVHNKIRINMLPPGKSLSPTISPGGGPLSQGLRRTPMASPFSPYHHGSSVLRSPASNHGQSPGILPTILSPGRSPTAQAPGQSSPTGSQVSINSNGQHKKDGES